MTSQRMPPHPRRLRPPSSVPEHPGTRDPPLMARMGPQLCAVPIPASLAASCCPSPWPSHTASLPVEGLMINLLWAQLWACGCLGPASGHAAPPSSPPTTSCRIITQEPGEPRPAGPPPHPWVCLVAPTLQPRSEEPGPQLPPGRSSMGLLECERLPGSSTGKRTEANAASLGGSLLPTASEAPLNSLLSHLPHNYSSRAGREGEALSTPAPSTPEIAQPVRGPAGPPQPLFVLRLRNAHPHQGSPRLQPPPPRALWPAASRPLGTDFPLLEYPELFQTLNHLCLWDPQKHLPSSPLF